MTTSSSDPPAQATTVLLVEDDAPTSWRLQDALGKAGYQVRAAGTLAEARAALAESAPKPAHILAHLLCSSTHVAPSLRAKRSNPASFAASKKAGLLRRYRSSQ